jgi:hypothetical protein
MKRRIIKLCGFILAGAIVNVAVAWGCGLVASSHSIQFARGRYTCLTRSLGQARINIDAGRMMISVNCAGVYADYLDRRDSISIDQFRGWLPQGSAFLSDLRTRIRGLFYFRECLAGWPSYSLRGDKGVSLNSTRDVSMGLFRLPQMDQSPGVWNELPFIPLWPGFAINTVFYAAVLWVLVAAPGFIRRRIRIKRGLCPSCGYPIGSSPLCTECGKPVRARRIEPTTS